MIDVESINDIADHKTIIARKKFTFKEVLYKNIYVRRRLTKENFQTELTKKLRETPYRHELDERVKNLYNAMKQAVNILIDQKVINIDYSKPWYDNELANLKHERDIAERSAEFLNN